jgi:predicted dehydrogenase
MKPLKIVVIGAGRMGTLHATKLSQQPGVALVSIADVDPARAEALAGQFGCRAFADWRQALIGADAAIVAVTAEQHFEVLRGCLESRVHALVEKPIATNVDEATALIALAHRQRVVLQVAHIERFNPAFGAIASRIDRPLFIDAERLAVFQPRGADVDVVLDLMIHDIDLTLALVGDDVSEVRACGFGVLTPGIDIANVYLEFRSGCVANLSASRVSQTKVRKLRVFQDNLYASADLQIGRVRYVKRAEATVEQSDESHEGGDPLAVQDQAFVAAVRGERPVAVTGEDGRRALDVALTVGRLVRERLHRFEATAA